MLPDGRLTMQDRIASLSLGSAFKKKQECRSFSRLSQFPAEGSDQVPLLLRAQVPANGAKHDVRQDLALADGHEEVGVVGQFNHGWPRCGVMAQQSGFGLTDRGTGAAKR